MGARSPCALVKRLRRKAHHFPSTSGEVKNKWRHNSNLHIRLHGVHRKKLFFYRKETVVAGSTVKKVKLSQHDTKAYRGSGRTAPVILNPKLDAGEWSDSHPGRLYPRGKSPSMPLNRRVDGPQSCTGRWAQEKNLLPLPVFNPRILQAAV